jgi:hypothetical protein
MLSRTTNRGDPLSFYATLGSAVFLMQAGSSCQRIRNARRIRVVILIFEAFCLLVLSFLLPLLSTRSACSALTLFTRRWNLRSFLSFVKRVPQISNVPTPLCVRVITYIFGNEFCSRLSNTHDYSQPCVWLGIILDMRGQNQHC